MFKISFDFNEITCTLSNVKVTNTSTERTRTSTIPNIDTDLRPDVEVLENKLQLSPKALMKLDVKADDRISIQYISEGIGKSAPVIGKAEAFTDRNDGNRTTKKGTVSFRGEKRNTLIEFGTLFNLGEYKTGIWKLIPFEEVKDDDSLVEENADADALNSSEIDKEIEAITASMEDDDLPF